MATTIDGTPCGEQVDERHVPLLGAVSPEVVAPERIAACVTWLLSDDAGDLDGAVLPSDGGWSVV